MKFSEFPHPGVLVARLSTVAKEHKIKEPITEVMVDRARFEFVRDLMLSFILSMKATEIDGRVIMERAPALTVDEEIVVHLSRKTYVDEDGVERRMYRAKFWHPDVPEPVALEDAP